MSKAGPLAKGHKVWRDYELLFVEHAMDAPNSDKVLIYTLKLLSAIIGGSVGKGGYKNKELLPKKQWMGCVKDNMKDD